MASAVRHCRLDSWIGRAVACIRVPVVVNAETDGEAGMRRERGEDPPGARQLQLEVFAKRHSTPSGSILLGCSLELLTESVEIALVIGPAPTEPDRSGTAPVKVQALQEGF